MDLSKEIIKRYKSEARREKIKAVATAIAEFITITLAILVILALGVVLV